MGSSHHGIWASSTWKDHKAKQQYRQIYWNEDAGSSLVWKVKVT